MDIGHGKKKNDENHFISFEICNNCLFVWTSNTCHRSSIGYIIIGDGSRIKNVKMFHWFPLKYLLLWKKKKKLDTLYICVKNMVMIAMDILNNIHF